MCKDSQSVYFWGDSCLKCPSREWFEAGHVDNAMTQTLYTVQSPTHDITRPWSAGRDYQPGGAYADMVQYLGYAPWVWCFETVEDYYNDWFVIEQMLGLSMWILRVPSDRVRWLSLDAQCENVLPVSAWFHPGPALIRRMGKTPQAIIKAPVCTNWIVSMQPALW